MAPNQEVFIAAASQITTSIRLGPMVRLLPLHHPVQLIEDMCVLDQLTGGRLDYGVGRGVAPIEHFWYGSTWAESKERFEDTLGIICRRVRNGRDLEREQQVPRLPDDADVDEGVPGDDPVLVPGQPGHGRSPRHEPDVRRPDPAEHVRRLRRDVAQAQGRHDARRWPRRSAAGRLHDAASRSRRPRTRRSRSPAAAWTA